jgi:hypothetical protein
MTLTPQIDVDILRIQEFSLNLRHEPFDFKGGGTWDFCRDYNIFSCSFNKRKKKLRVQLVTRSDYYSIKIGTQNYLKKNKSKPSSPGSCI